MKHPVEGLTLCRGGFRLPRVTLYLMAACLYGAGFVTAVWVTALIRS